jgi:hypothetical protein
MIRKVSHMVREQASSNLRVKLSIISMITADAPRATRRRRATFGLLDQLFALRAHCGRDARGPSTSLEWTNLSCELKQPLPQANTSPRCVTALRWVGLSARNCRALSLQRWDGLLAP